MRAEWNRLLVERNVESAGEGPRRVRRSVTVNLGESVLGWLHARGHVTTRQFDAGERADPTETQLGAKRRFEDAVAAAGPGLSDVLWRIVCAGEGMGEAERALGWPGRTGKVVLALALDRVADYYRMPGGA